MVYHGSPEVKHGFKLQSRCVCCWSTRFTPKVLETVGEEDKWSACH